jgi:hypothetical protein
MVGVYHVFQRLSRRDCRCPGENLSVLGSAMELVLARLLGAISLFGR